MKQNQIIMIVAVALFTGIGFFGGMKYQQTKTTTFGGQNNFQGMRNNSAQNGGNRSGDTQGGQQRVRGGFSPISGEIISADTQSVTVKLADGSSKIVLLSDKTSINKAQIATTTDLKVGEKVAIMGTTNTDGSVTASNIQLNPIDRQALMSPAPTK